MSVYVGNARKYVIFRMWGLPTVRHDTTMPNGAADRSKNGSNRTMRPLQYARSNGGTDAPTPAGGTRVPTRPGPFASLAAFVAWVVRGGAAAAKRVLVGAPWLELVLWAVLLAALGGLALVLAATDFWLVPDFF